MTDAWQTYSNHSDTRNTSKSSKSASPGVKLLKRNQSTAKSKSTTSPSLQKKRVLLARRSPTIDKAADLSIYTGDIDDAIMSALKGKDQMAVLQFEDQIVQFMARSRGIPSLKFHSLPRFKRLLIHRLAQRFNLQHEATIDHDAQPAALQSDTATTITLYKTNASKIPGISLLQIVQGMQTQQTCGQRKILLKKRSSGKKSQPKKITTTQWFK